MPTNNFYLIKTFILCYAKRYLIKKQIHIKIRIIFQVYIPSNCLSGLAVQSRKLPLTLAGESAPFCNIFDSGPPNQ